MVDFNLGNLTPELRLVADIGDYAQQSKYIWAFLLSEASVWLRTEKGIGEGSD